VRQQKDGYRGEEEGVSGLGKSIEGEPVRVRPDLSEKSADFEGVRGGRGCLTSGIAICRGL